MIRAQNALMRQAQEMFRMHLAGLFSFDDVRSVDDRQEIPSVERRERGVSRWQEQIRLQFEPWEIVAISPNQAPPLGSLKLIEMGLGREIVVSGPLDPATWAEIGKWVRSHTHQRRIAS